MSPYIVAFAAAFFLSTSVAPVIGHLARRLGIIDRPDGHRKLHAREVPLTGGPVVLLSAVIAMVVTLLLFPDVINTSGEEQRFLLCLLASSIVIVVVGMIDDCYGLRGRQKLFGQFIAALIMVPSGILIQRITAFGVTIEFGDMSALVTLFWIMGAVNALNLIDGVDGLASTTGIVLSLSVAAVTYVLGGRADGLVMSLILAGSLGGFLIYNFPPARMFLGDSGSMLIGLILGCVALKCSLKHYTAAALIMPTAIWAIPIFDVSMAIVRRKLTGRSIYSTDRAHLHHCLLRKGLSGETLLLLVAGLCGITGIGAVLSAALDSELIAVVGVATAITLLVVTRSFGHAELALLSSRVRRFSGTMFRPGPGGRPEFRDEQIRLHGKHQWEELWLTLTEFAERFQMDGVELMVTVPNVGEEYHANWRRRVACDQHEAWKSEIPLMVNGSRVGQLKIVGASAGGSMCEWMADLIAGLRPFELQLIGLIEELQELHGIPKRRTRTKSGMLQLQAQPQGD
jgi:UDP-GlcNAc:undecaprenyl-phosphate GlcNAc-1-phosphate transferase